MSGKVGFMQGRLSDLIKNKIQAFPSKTWADEFSKAAELGFNIMEWTLDYENIYENPLLIKNSHNLIRDLMKKYLIQIPSLTGDCFMQKPFWKSQNLENDNLKKIFIDVVKSSSELGINYIVLPLVDNGRLDSHKEEEALIEFLFECRKLFQDLNIKILFESDKNPDDLGTFIKKFDKHIFGINYDIGNSAASGYDPNEEFRNYGDYINNVHVKDRRLKGTTVPLTEGNANFKLVFSLLGEFSYKGNFILQTARCPDGNHELVLSKYYLMTRKWISDYIDKK